MPELPEVETVRRQLHERLAGRTLQSLQWLRLGREFPEGDVFTRRLQGKQLLGVERRAKVLVWRFVDDLSVLGHLKMTGKFLFVDHNYLPTKHDRAIFVFDGKDDESIRVVWSDVRQFGYLKLVAADELVRVLDAYGPEPLETSAEDFAVRLVKPKTRTVKAALLDQTCIAGIGNIYADEACHRAGIRPTRRLETLTAADRLRLAQEAQNVLRESIAQKGTSANDYVDTQGERGGFLGLLRVYGRKGEPCGVCTTPIKKMVLAGRGTHYCPTCQR